MKFSTWFNTYKVLIIGLIISIIQPIIDLMNTGEVAGKTIALAAVGAAISWFARNLRGQVQTIAGILQVALGNYISLGTTDKAAIIQIVLQALIAFLAASTSPVKSRGYEHTDIIVEAKREGEIIAPSPAPPPAEK